MILLNHPFSSIKNPVRLDGICCPTRARTWTFLNQNQACCQLHHRTISCKDQNSYKKTIAAISPGLPIRTRLGKSELFQA